MGLKPGEGLVSPITDLALLHKIEHAPGWVYATVWRFVTWSGGDLPEFEPFKPPVDGLSWELNIDRAPDLGREVSTPSWSDGTRYMEATYWRAQCPPDGEALAKKQYVQLPDA